MPLTLRPALPLLLAMPAVAAATPVENPWFVHAGVARMATDEAIRASVLGSPLPGAALDVEPRYTASAEIGRFLLPTVAVSVSAGLPVRQRIDAAGSIRPLGTLGKASYGPAALTAHWHPLPHSQFRPYVGGGVTYLHVFDSDAGAVANFRLHDDVGPLVQGGAELMTGRRLGVFIDAKKGWLTSSAGGTLGGAPVGARVRLNPLVLSAGAALRF